MRAAELGFSKSHNYLGMHYYHGENWKKAKFHLQAAAMAGHEGARNNIGHLEFLQFNNTEGLLSIGSLLHLLGHILP